MASKSATSIWAGLEMAKSKRQRQKLETKSGGISNISGLDGRPTGTRDRLFHRFSFPALECLLLIAVSRGLPRLMLLLLLAVRGPQVLDKHIPKTSHIHTKNDAIMTFKCNS